MGRDRAAKLAAKLHSAGFLHPEIVKAYDVKGWYLRIHSTDGSSYTLISKREVRDTIRQG
jgi:hypothetical protein